MNIILVRTNVKELTTDGYISIDGMRICDTAEATPTLLPVGVYEVKISKCGRAARRMPIVHGEPSPLKCRLCKAAVFDRKRAKLNCYCQLEEAMLMETPDAELHSLEATLADDVRKNHSYMSYCPQIKSGNGVYHQTDGGILVGRFLQPGIVTRSREVFDRLYERIEKAVARGHKIHLIIRQK